MFRVRWHTDALLQLADIWTAIPDRAAANRAVGHIDDQLAREPHTIGRPQADAMRSYRRAPLEVLYEVVDSDVRIVAVRLVRTDLN